MNRKCLLAHLCILAGVAACNSGSDSDAAQAIVSTFESRVAVDAPAVLAAIPPASRNARAPEIQSVKAPAARRVGTRAFAAEDGGFAATAVHFDSAKLVKSPTQRIAPNPRAAAKVNAPARSSGAFRVEDEPSLMAIDATLRGTDDVKGRVSQGMVVYPNAVRGGHWIHAAEQDGLQDYVSFDRDTGVTSLSYDVALTNVSSLRLVANSLEFLDKTGAPRLRVPAPSVVGNDHKQHTAKLSVEGCAVDTSAAAPWGRSLPPAGASHCTVHVDWSGVELAYPAVIDPSWTTTANMSAPRTLHGSLLVDGRVLVSGGYNSNDGQIDTAELYDPATGTWAATGSMNKRRIEHTMNLLPSGRALATGGATFEATSETYDPTTGLWTLQGSMSVPRYGHRSVSLADGRVLVTGGSWYDYINNINGDYLKSAEIYDNGVWTPVADMSDARMHSTLDLLPDGRVLVTGLAYGAWRGGSSAEIFDATSGSWTPTGPMISSDRFNAASVVLTNGKVVVAGGSSGMWGDALATAEMYDPATNGWTDLGTVLSQPRFGLRSAASNGYYYFIGGQSGSTWNPEGPATAAVDVFNGSAWNPSPPAQLNQTRTWFSATATSYGILVAGGASNTAYSVPLNTAELTAASATPPPLALVPADIGFGQRQASGQRPLLLAFIDYNGTGKSRKFKYPPFDPKKYGRLFFGGDGGLNVKDFYGNLSHGTFGWVDPGFIIANPDPSDPSLRIPIIVELPSKGSDEFMRFSALQGVLKFAKDQGLLTQLQQLDLNGDGKLFEDELTVVLITNGLSFDPNNPENNPDGIAIGGTTRNISNDKEGAEASNCASIDAYPMQFCSSGRGWAVVDAGKDNSMQVFEHELAHTLAAIDLYPWTPFGDGNTNATTMGGVNPYPGHSDRTFSLWIEAWHRMQFGWDAPTMVDAQSTQETSFAFSTPGQILALHYGPSRFFLLESRKRSAPDDANVVEDGVAVWYVDYSRGLVGIEGVESGRLNISSFIKNGQSFELNWPGYGGSRLEYDGLFSLRASVALNSSGNFVVTYKTGLDGYRGAVRSWDGRCMEAGESAEGPAMLGRCDGLRSQSWRVFIGSKELKNEAGLCLTSDVTSDGLPVQAKACTGGVNQQWDLTGDNGTDSWFFESQGKCLLLTNAPLQAQQLVTGPCTSVESQRWSVPENVPYGPSLRNQDKCMTAVDHLPGSAVQLSPCSHQLFRQAWQLTENGEIKLITELGPRCLEADLNSVTIKMCDSSDLQHWQRDILGRLQNGLGLSLAAPVPTPGNDALFLTTTAHDTSQFWAIEAL